MPQFGQVPYSAIDGTRRAMMAKMLAGKQNSAFDNTIGTGPGAVKSVATKPDGSRTTTYNTPAVEPIPASQAVSLADSGPRGYNASPQVPSQLPVQQAPAATAAPAAQGGGGLSGFLSNPGVWNLLGSLGQAITADDQNSFGYQAGGLAKGYANNALYQRALASMLGGEAAGAPGASSQNPNSASGSLAGLGGINGLSVTPEMIQGLIKQNEDLQTGASDRAYKAALASGVETPEEQLNRQALITLLGKDEPRQQPLRIEEINLSPDGKITSPDRKYKWAIDAEGNPVRPVGGFFSSPAEGDDSGQSSVANWYQKAVNTAENFLKQKEAQYGEIIELPDGRKSIQWKTQDAPQKLQADYRRFLYEEIRKLQRTGVIPPGFENVALPDVPAEDILLKLQGTSAGQKPAGSAFPNAR